MNLFKKETKKFLQPLLYGIPCAARAAAPMPATEPSVTCGSAKIMQINWRSREISVVTGFDTGQG